MTNSWEGLECWWGVIGYLSEIRLSTLEAAVKDNTKRPGSDEPGIAVACRVVVEK